MRRLLQLGVLFITLAICYAPLAELFDRWDTPGLFNDTEFTIFALILVLCLVLLVSKLIATLALIVHLVERDRHQQADPLRLTSSNSFFERFSSLFSPFPLRI
ncbi:hypothetical protein [Edaphobacter albus]|uniref:hypothetical protein n=1 Tax=Edaphobacter sp. 4G125 TaxID=2763071 RepID=UPI001648A62D|nr:hypothetical protein [Edaphobacter sp. 4G125]QNI36409.1 hypothetical protein H7846_15790 [Edaphobacter sp. 4G125]